VPLFTSPGLIVSAADGVEAHHPLFGWRNQVSVSNIAADSETIAGPATNLANPATSLLWVSGSTAEQLVTVTDLVGEIDYVGIARHNFGSADIDISVEAVTADSSPDFVEVLSAQAPADDSPLVLRFARDFYSAVRVRLVPDGTAPRMAVLFVGKLLAIVPGLKPGFTPIGEARNIQLVNGLSEAGEHLGSIVVGASLESAAEFEDIDPDFYASDVRPFVRGASAGDPFFFVWDPATHPEDAAFCWLTRPAMPVISRTTGEHSLSLSLGGLAL
jgi:hypothetical protein